MSNMNKKTHNRLYPLLMAIQGGEYCIICGLDKKTLAENGKSAVLCIDVKDNSHNHSISNIKNMQLLCYGCNTKKNHPSTQEPFTRSATPEILLNKKYETHFRRWVIGFYMENDNIGLRYEFLINAGAEVVGCSQETIKRYLAKMTSDIGMYIWENRPGQEPLLFLRNEMKYTSKQLDDIDKEQSH